MSKHYYCTTWNYEGTIQYIERYDTLKARNNRVKDSESSTSIAAAEALTSDLPIIDRDHSGGAITGRWVRGRADII